MSYMLTLGWLKGGQWGGIYGSPRQVVSGNRSFHPNLGSKGPHIRDNPRPGPVDRGPSRAPSVPVRPVLGNRVNGEFNE